MFPKDETFYFDGCVRNIVTILTKKSLDDIVYTTETHQIYLGRFLRSEILRWRNGKTVQNGFAVFECGCVMFPDFGSVKMYRGNDISYADTQFLSLYDVY
jgi:hypothetical protein